MAKQKNQPKQDDAPKDEKSLGEKISDVVDKVLHGGGDSSASDADADKKDDSTPSPAPGDVVRKSGKKALKSEVVDKAKHDPTPSPCPGDFAKVQDDADKLARKKREQEALGLIDEDAPMASGAVDLVKLPADDGAGEDDKTK